jgi:hypothetical protein
LLTVSDVSNQLKPDTRSNVGANAYCAEAKPQRELVGLVARHPPDLDRKAFLAVLQDATAAAEKQATRRH